MSYTINTIFGEEEMSIEDTKVCSICGERKHMHEFQLRSGKKENFEHTIQNRRNECKCCKTEINRQTALAKKKAGPCPSNHTCPICERTEEQLRGEHGGWANKSPFVLDHCHVTGVARGWICQHCNIMLGKNGANDNIKTLKNAIKYLTFEPTNDSMFL